MISYFGVFQNIRFIDSLQTSFASNNVQTAFQNRKHRTFSLKMSINLFHIENLNETSFLFCFVLYVGNVGNKQSESQYKANYLENIIKHNRKEV
jgi:hypothetical protein